MSLHTFGLLKPYQSTLQTQVRRIESEVFDGVPVFAKEYAEVKTLIIRLKLPKVKKLIDLVSEPIPQFNGMPLMHLDKFVIQELRSSFHAYPISKLINHFKKLATISALINEHLDSKKIDFSYCLQDVFAITKDSHSVILLNIYKREPFKFSHELQNEFKVIKSTHGKITPEDIRKLKKYEETNLLIQDHLRNELASINYNSFNNFGEFEKAVEGKDAEHMRRSSALTLLEIIKRKPDHYFNRIEI